MDNVSLHESSLKNVGVKTMALRICILFTFRMLESPKFVFSNACIASSILLTSGIRKILYGTDNYLSHYSFLSPRESRMHCLLYDSILQVVGALDYIIECNPICGKVCSPARSLIQQHACHPTHKAASETPLNHMLKTESLP